MNDRPDAPWHFKLRDIIAALETENPDLTLPLGFDSPHSYRGYHDQLAFVPAENITVRAMLDAARSALDAVFPACKGLEDYTMRGHTECWLADDGQAGETIGRVLLRLLLDAGRAAAHAAPSDTAAGQPDGRMQPIVVHDTDRGADVRFTGRHLHTRPDTREPDGQWAAYLTGKGRIAVHSPRGILDVYENLDRLAADVSPTDGGFDDAFVAAVAAALGRPHIVDLDF